MLRRVIHESLKLFRREEVFEFGVDSVHTIHILGTRKAFLTELGILEMHPIDGVDTNGVRNTQLACQTHRLRQSFLLRSALNAPLYRLLSPHQARYKGHTDNR